MQYASHPFTQTAIGVWFYRAVRTRAFVIGVSVGIVLIVGWLVGMPAADRFIQRTPAVELRPIAVPMLSAMSIDLAAAAPNPASRTRAVDNPAQLLETIFSTEQIDLARFISQRYRVALADTTNFVGYAYVAAEEFELDPLLLLAIMSVESSFRADARSSKGAKGLMQVLARVHPEKFAPFGGMGMVYDPLVNVRVGARILRDYLARDGSVRAALKSYVGAALMSHDFGYGGRVLGEYDRLAAVVAPDAGRGVHEPRTTTVARERVQRGTTTMRGKRSPVAANEADTVRNRRAPGAVAG